ncbi:UNVERIFIED_CONTAM: Integrator complex subunit 11 [Siphonaria sp. JEL0065]|nr:Integrator complex subunit 11 [Siphonaria sp. JEL0065]
MGFSDNRRFPDFSYLSKTGNFNGVLDCIIISHFHLDHCGALPYFTEICGYDGPIYMTTPTRAIAPILLDDMRKVVSERKGDTNFFTSQEIRACLSKVIPVTLHETVHVDSELSIKPYYAGHVLGAAMFHIQVGDLSVVYTGDYNMTPDRHLGAAWIDDCQPDLLITETTYATTTRASKRTRELDFLQQVHECVLGGGKVLIPVFALGRAQELCILIDSYWAQTGLKAPIYFSAGLTERANQYYKLFLGWTNEKIKTSFNGSETHQSHNMFDFKHIKPFDRTYADEPGPMVLFASPGMLHAGQSLDVFKKWCGDPKNMIILPGYCVPGTVGAKVLAGEKVIDIDKVTRVNVNLQVKNLSFSAHADSKGILQLIGMCRPKNVMLVHGEARKMAVLKERIYQETGIPCYDPPNGTSITIACPEYIHAIISEDSIQRAMANVSSTASREKPKKNNNKKYWYHPAIPTPTTVPFMGAVFLPQNTTTALPTVLDTTELAAQQNIGPISFTFRFRKTFSASDVQLRHQQQQQFQQDQQHQQQQQKRKFQHEPTPHEIVYQNLDTQLKQCAGMLRGEGKNVHVQMNFKDKEIRVNRVVVRILGGGSGRVDGPSGTVKGVEGVQEEEEDCVLVEWGEEKDIAVRVVAIVNALL